MNYHQELSTKTNKQPQRAKLIQIPDDSNFLQSSTSAFINKNSSQFIRGFDLNEPIVSTNQFKFPRKMSTTSSNHSNFNSTSSSIVHPNELNSFNPIDRYNSLCDFQDNIAFRKLPSLN
jgi:hypothetical protein